MTDEQTSIDIIKEVVSKFEILLEYNMKEELLHSSMVGLIESTPQSMHKSVMLKFTFMLGYHKGLTKEQIYQVLSE